jgi:hypothetical protein
LEQRAIADMLREEALIRTLFGGRAMSEFLPGVGPVHEQHTQINIPSLDEAAVPEKPIPPLTAEQVRAVDAALAHENDQESATVAGLLGMWTGSMLLKDLAQEHFSPPADEELIQEKPKAKPEEEE